LAGLPEELRAVVKDKGLEALTYELSIDYSQLKADQVLKV
jgi:hypothetical protein